MTDQEVVSDLPLSNPIQYNQQLLNEQSNDLPDNYPPNMDPVVYDSNRLDNNSDEKKNEHDQQLPSYSQVILERSEMNNPVQSNNSTSTSNITSTSNPTTTRSTINDDVENVVIPSLEEIEEVIGSLNIQQLEPEDHTTPRKKRKCNGSKGFLCLFSSTEYAMWAVTFLLHILYMISSFSASEFSELTTTSYVKSTQPYAILFIFFAPVLSTMKYTRIMSEQCCCNKKKSRRRRRRRKFPCCCIYVTVITFIQIVGLFFMVIYGGVMKGKLFQHPIFDPWIEWMVNISLVVLLCCVLMSTIFMGVGCMGRRRRRSKRRSKRRRKSGEEQEGQQEENGEDIELQEVQAV